MLRNLPRRAGRALRMLVLVVVAIVIAALSAEVVAQPGYDADVLESGVLAPQDEADYGVGLEAGVLGPADELEPGLIGLDDPIFVAPTAPPPRYQLRPPGWVDRELLEPGLIGLDDPIFRSR